MYKLCLRWSQKKKRESFRLLFHVNWMARPDMDKLVSQEDLTMCYVLHTKPRGFDWSRNSKLPLSVGSLFQESGDGRWLSLDTQVSCA
jgi:hypothetical protein